ncbi:Zn-dependent protease with chaperone function [Chitinophaga dinghuensis]|uniref:Zn-dependent protease with chaperone function n=1 Tax=Chitinophaga dinghuensis TaxID=1539050 RepID=A0A327W348_9BACT|nr:M48 family metallopeptidase [Chitinophaga dinghuensis]RAJ83637.1 Zn-dependent protease with chaperone function [Chitinophaga dinghuensis]
MTTFYPPNPTIPGNTRTTNPALRKAFRKSVISILLSLLLPFLLILIAIAWYCHIISDVALPKSSGQGILLTLLLGLAALAGLMLYFLIAKICRRTPPTGMIITEDEHPQLYAFIRQLAADAGVPAPAKIFLNPEMNAAVRYSGGYLSPLFRNAKDLHIGLGLVNSLNLGEFKAVIAHEMGHFTQRSMRIGGYVGILNKVLYVMLYEYRLKMPVKTSTHSNIDAFFQLLREKGWRLMEMLLIPVYRIINKRYSRLSLEMEYQADLVSLSLAGSRNLIHALRRLTFASMVTPTLTKQIEKLHQQGRQLQNMFVIQTLLAESEAQQLGLSLEAGLPVIADAGAVLEKRLQLQDVWATHPTMEERVSRAAAADNFGVEDKRSPWILFEAPVMLQEKMTRCFYREKYPCRPEEPLIATEAISQQLLLERAPEELPVVFKRYYNVRMFNKASARIPMDTEYDSLEKIYSEENILRVNNRVLLGEEIHSLRAIRDGALESAGFKYNGKLYQPKDAEQLCDTLMEEFAKEMKWQLELDQKALSFHLHQAAAGGPARIGRLAIIHSRAHEAELFLLQNRKAPDTFIAYFLVLQSGDGIHSSRLPSLVKEFCKLQTDMLSSVHAFIAAQQDVLTSSHEFVMVVRKWEEQKYTFMDGGGYNLKELIPVYENAVRYLECMREMKELRRQHYLQEITALQQ